MTNAALLVVILGANVLGTVMVMPQAVSVVRTGRVAGVSPSWVGAGLVFNAWWLGYGIGADSHAVIPVSAISVATYLVLALALAHHRPLTAGPLVRTGSAAAITPLVALVGGGWTAVGVLLGLLYGAQLLPAVVQAWRSADTSGVARSTWMMAWGEALLFGIHAAVHTDPGLAVLALSGLVMSTAMLVLTATSAAGRSGRSPRIRNGAAARIALRAPLRPRRGFAR